MARLILHARYFAPNAKKRAARLSYLMKYYATREGVEKPNHKQENHFPASENQQETIRKMLEQVPELTDTHEYEDYTETPTVANASGNSEGSSTLFRSIESFLYRASKVFEDKRPVGNQGQAMDRKAYVKQTERKSEIGMQ